MDRPVEFDHLALEEVDALGRVDGSAEHLDLDVLDVGGQASGDRLVVVDHLVQDGPHHRERTGLEQLRTSLEPLAGRAQLARRAVPEGDREACGRRKCGSRRRRPRRAPRRSGRCAERRSSAARSCSIFARWCSCRASSTARACSGKDAAISTNLLWGRVVDAEPDEAVAARCARRGLGDRHRPRVLAHAVRVVSAVDDQLRSPAESFDQLAVPPRVGPDRRRFTRRTDSRHPARYGCRSSHRPGRSRACDAGWRCGCAAGAHRHTLHPRPR